MLPKLVNDLKDEFLEDLTDKESSIEQYRKILSWFIKWQSMKKDCDPANPTRRTFSQFYRELRDKKRSVRTLDNYTVVIRKFFKWLIALGYYDTDITEGTKPLRKSNDFIKAPLSMDQATRLLKSISGNTVIELRDYAIINTVLRTGLRRIEISRLNHNDIIKAGSQYYIRIQGKGHDEKDCELPITRDILEPIQKYWKHRPDMYKEAPAFISHARCSSERITPHVISVMVKTRLRSIGIDNKLYSCHSLRHSAAYFAIKAGAKAIEVQQMLRHKDGRVTEQYKKAFNEERIKDGTAVLELDKYFKKYTESGLKQTKNNF